MSGFNQADKHGGKDEMLTPLEIIRALGHFDLDPCFGHPRPWETADVMVDQHGLNYLWQGRVWLNPPYSQMRQRGWTKKMRAHRNGIMLTFARTETEWFQKDVFPHASALLFIAGRLSFYKPDGTLATTLAGKVSNAGAPSVLSAFDSCTPANAIALRHAVVDGTIKGAYIPLRESAR